MLTHALFGSLMNDVINIIVDRVRTCYVDSRIVWLIDE